MRLSWLAGAVSIFILAACNSVSPSPTALAVQITTVPSPTETVTVIPSPVQTATPVLILNLITPTPLPSAQPATLPPAATPSAVTDGTPAPTSPPSLSNTAADRALIAILQQCWKASDPRQLNGANAAHRDAFDCGRASLMNLTVNFPAYALVHRVLAWGYFYKDDDLQKAIQEYRTAANLYHSANDPVGESESRMRLGLLLATTSRSQACAELASAGHLNPQNDRAFQYYQSYACATVASGRTSGGTPIAPPPPPKIDLAAIRGKIVFKSDRTGSESYFVMDPDGGNVKEINYSTYQAAGQWESWSQNRQQVATVRSAGFNRKFGYNNDIWITDPQGGSGRPLENPANDYDPVWSPGGLFDGRDWLAFVSNRGDIAHPDNQGEELWVMHPDGSNSLRLTCHGPIFSKHPSWSPDSGKLVFYSNYPAGGNSQVFMIDLTNLGNVSDPCNIGDTIRNISNSPSNDYEPVWVK